MDACAFADERCLSLRNRHSGGQPHRQPVRSPYRAGAYPTSVLGSPTRRPSLSPFLPPLCVPPPPPPLALTRAFSMGRGLMRPDLRAGSPRSLRRLGLDQQAPSTGAESAGLNPVNGGEVLVFGDEHQVSFMSTQCMRAPRIIGRNKATQPTRLEEVLPHPNLFQHLTHGAPNQVTDHALCPCPDRLIISMFPGRELRLSLERERWLGRRRVL